ncbi:hypothetical protein HY479_00455 [Candidatus Uhrbacteria bacterium]|nr:hypothetical protein [Candidatus Uhrbacteria bacterium]
MPWQIPVVLRIITAHVAHPIIQKKLAGLPSRTRRLRAMFLMCLVLSAGYAAVSPSPFVLDRWFILICAIGVANSFAAYASWRAVDMSLSKTALFTFMDDVIPITLGIVLLGENKIITPALGLGVVLCVGAVIVNTVMDSREKPAEEGKTGWRIFLWIGIYSVIWGVAHFLFRVFALNGVSLPTFLVGWYGGAFLGSFAVLHLMGEKEAGPTLTRRGIAGVAILTTTAFSSLALAYWANQNAPLAVTQPIFQVSEMILPTLIGLLYFKEAKHLDGKRKLLFAVAFIGSLVVALNY